ncbi:Oidioi.mRNA.OKI2018_I69.chr2.g4699.t1.cds [Oikopleura dioica]|uniref:Hexosyltransferase n=1 Tax=Oikopleura dioica TaxID=34765 RepID=A0ABN7SY53_OIKDI|nr:Oidioi.mRNA.OKI2018_I69.chr2.g4699.t1.cds [Oikopleura dioica]
MQPDRYSICTATLGIIILLLIFFVENEETDEIESFYHEPWRAGKNITPNDFIFENEICNPISIPPKWRYNKPWKIGFQQQPDCPKNLKLLILVESAPNHFEHRKVLRQFFRKMRRSDMAFFFILGRSDVEIVDEIEDDIIVGDFDDKYSNLPSKTKVAYEYFADCEDPPEFMIMQDDDTVADVEPILNILYANEETKSRSVYGVLHTKVPRMNSWMRGKNMWVGTASWPYQNWPDYISGPCTFMDKEAALAIADAATTALEIFSIPIEDALFTGILRVKGCVDIRGGAPQCHHLVGNVDKLKTLTGYDENWVPKR